MKVWGITIVKTSHLEYMEIKIDDLTNRLQHIEYLRFTEINCPVCGHKTIARAKYAMEGSGGYYCYGCGNTFDKTETAVYTQRK